MAGVAGPGHQEREGCFYLMETGGLCLAARITWGWITLGSPLSKSNGKGQVWQFCRRWARNQKFTVLRDKGMDDTSR